MSHVWVMYDIKKDRIRSRIAKYCKRLGLIRVQKSVFFGRLSIKDTRRIAQALQRNINPNTDTIVIQPVGWRHIKLAQNIGNTTHYVVHTRRHTHKFF